MDIHFYGAARQVTGSCYLLEAGNLRILVDCGLYQEREFISRNWEPFPFDPSSVDVMVLTHAHLDHVGLIPKLVKEGFGGDIFMTPPTRELARIILTDAAHIQEEDAAFKRKRHAREGRASPRPVVPLYVLDDVNEALRQFRIVECGETSELDKNVSFTLHEAGHILGSTSVAFHVREGTETRTVLFSGDLGQWDKPLVNDPSCIETADYVVMESTYGDRRHADNGPIEDQLADVINSTIDAGGNILIPTFAVERAQELMYYIGKLVRNDRVPNLMCFLDSPMAVNVTEVFRAGRHELDAEAQAVLNAGESLFAFPGMKLVRHVSDSKAINRIRGSCVIMAGSGMCTAGRIKHHLVRNISRPESTIAFVGYQADGTLGRQIVDGRSRVRILGKMREVKARIAQIHGLSAHADSDELLRWLSCIEQPKRIFLTHGEEKAALTLRDIISHGNGLDVEVPNYKGAYELD